MRTFVTLLLAALLVLSCAAGARADYVGNLNPSGDNFLALRSGPGTTYRILRKLGPDTFVQVLSSKGAWRYVELEDGARGWAHGDYILPGEPPGWDDGEADDTVVMPPDEDKEEPAPPDAVPRFGHWTVYVNDRFGTSIEYPGDAFEMAPPPENDDGRSFVAIVGSARFIVFASTNVFDKTLDELMTDDVAAADDDNITYRRSGEDWYVLSGYRGPDIFYRRTLVSDAGTLVHTFEIIYPKDQKRLFDPVVARIASSLAAGPQPPPDDELDDEPAVIVEPPVEEPEEPGPNEIDTEDTVAIDSWRAPLEEAQFDGSESALFLPHQAHGGVFATSATYAGGALVVDVPPNSGWGKVGLLSIDPLVWMDDFHDDAITRVTFTFDPDRTTGFGLSLAQPGWGGVGGNDPGYPDVRFYWIRNPGGEDARVELHVDPHGTDDFWKGTAGPDAPTEVTFVLTPGKVGVEVDGTLLAERSWPALRSGNGLRIYAFSHPADVNLPVRMALRSIETTRVYPTLPEQFDPAPGVELLPTETLFSGEPTPVFEPAAVAGGDFDAFARYRDGALWVDVPAGHSWAKTGLISAEPLVVLDNRARETPVRLALTVDPAGTKTFAVAFSGDKAVEMWLSHNAWFALSRREDLGAYLMTVNAGPYNDRVRLIPIAWFDAHWDGRIEIDLGNDLGCIRVPEGPELCAQQPLGVGNRLYATILAHAPLQDQPTGLVLKEITRGLVTPPGLTADRRWFFVDDAAFDPGEYLEDLGDLLK